MKKLEKNKRKKLAERLNDIDFSRIRKAFSLAYEIKNPLDLSIGQPDFDVPQVVKNFATKAIDLGFNKYTVTNGIFELRKAISKKLAEENNLYTSPNEIIVTSGTSAAIFLTFLVLIKPKDEVILFDPYFVTFKIMADFFNANLRIIDTYPTFQPDLQKLERAITPKTKLIIINSPNNPTGIVYKTSLIKGIVDIAKRNNAYILSDEIYEDFIYEGTHFSPGSIYRNTITINGFSKSCSMSGWRIGYVVAPKEIIKEMIKWQQFIFVCAPSIAQKAAIEALKYNNENQIKRYKVKRDIIYNGLKDYFDIRKPHGAFYIFVKCPYDQNKFIQDLLKEKVVVVPGDVFSQRKGYVRISFANSNIVLKKAVSIFRKLALSIK